MTSILLDTHIWAWSLTGATLPPTIRAAIETSEAVFVSPISFYEIGQKVRLGKWPEMEPYIADLPAILKDQGGLVATLSPEVSLLAATMDWPHRDPFDRFLAATSLVFAIPLATVDPVFHGLVIDGRRLGLAD